ncbi:Caveolin-1 protein [Quillaja saponaria]|uniref:Caveolin-1 protein n=1 Tax=Quillaja saponaria TaxID=32244 RepID=A0AAD7PSW1_QUISA|nr:Caveolin-1 protein [Quillaja saponaria]
MHHCLVWNLFILISSLYIIIIIINGPALCFGNMVGNKILIVGEELWRETMPLKGGSRYYQLQGLKSNSCYEVKISYPASIPASFSLQLRRGKLDLAKNSNRRLLNTEKLVFKTESLDLGELYVLVTVEPEGIVAITNVTERQFISFNIVCDELLLGVPYKAWWVVVLGLLCLGLAFIIPSFLPSYLLPSSRAADHSVSKDS